MKIVITCALPVEFNEARNQLGLIEKTTKKEIPRIAARGGLILIYTGIGKNSTILNLYPLIIKENPDLIIDTGTCGSLTGDIPINSIVISNSSIEFFNIDNPNNNTIIGDTYSVKTYIPNIDISELVVASIEKSINSESDVNKLKEKGASIVTWETYSVFSLCKKLDINFVSVRAVTDCCNHSTLMDFKRNKVESCKKLYISVKKLCNGI
ncbi:MAG: hypothetical protein OCD02_22110 [Spirochaetaceae bacterium]